MLLSPRNASRRSSGRGSFTLIELLVVMAIIAILASLIIYAGIGVINKGKRSRAASEISAMSTALEGYKTDNGIYPANNPALGNAGVSTSLVTNSAASPYVSASKDGTGTDYQQNSQIVYLALSGQTNFNDAAVGAKSYMSFTRSQSSPTPQSSLLIAQHFGYLTFSSVSLL